MTTFILLMIAGALNAVMDRLAFTFKSSIFKNLNPYFWDVKQSWKNQWKQPLQPPYSYWYYFGFYTPRYQENYPFSSTFLVWTTDAWHLAKTLMLGLMMVATTTYKPMFAPGVDVFLMYSAFTVAFTYFYEYILKAK